MLLRFAALPKPGISGSDYLLLLHRGRGGSWSRGGAVWGCSCRRIPCARGTGGAWRAASIEADLRHFTVPGLSNGEAVGLFKMEHPGNNIGRENFQPCIVLHNNIIIELAGISNLLLKLGKLVLQVKEILVCLKFRIIFSSCKDIDNSTAKRSLCSCALVDIAAGHGIAHARPRPGHLFKN